MDNVIPFTGLTIVPCAPDSVLDSAKGKNLVRVLVVGVHEDGELWFSGSHSDTAENLLALERAKKVLLSD